MDNNIDVLKQLLFKQKEDIEKTINNMKNHKIAEQDVDSPNELSNYDNHPAEIATELFQLELNNGLKVHEENLLKEIHDALSKMNNGKYGKCEICGNKISHERLEALPYSRLCINCENNKEVTMEFLDKQRPVEEQVLDTPLGRKHLNSKEDDEFEGIDQLNDLLKYGSADTPQDMGGYEDYEEFYTNELDKQGIVDHMDNVSNEEYKRQLP
ncbi:TraR/DksA C4-type zinc finger protein [Herbivorax sp. ANBcel31]|uniref:TraR/DksA C4-type zinc finger protein n=1 Tax=Herbivorax sp. ANBcel31 TaxID=3069754 RepID=UPI0027B4AC8F|nr:TraR/DksA C4-type zinc finger protein [Herbivorax sp. ANBcel31]MDQ2086155.1 TraR/DksA C4-type zinc finger protein [Herbivorax sp. ANBcel31]